MTYWWAVAGLIPSRFASCFSLSPSSSDRSDCRRRGDSVEIGGSSAEASGPPIRAAGPAWNRDDAEADLDATPPPTEFALLEERALEVVDIHCVVCHQAEPAWAAMPVPPKGVRFDDPETLRFHAGRIAAQAAWSRAMPPGNVTSMTPEERRVLGAWAARAGG